MAEIREAQGKRCSKCCVTKERSEFGRHAQSVDGLRYWCKPCNRESAANYRANNLDKVRKQGRSNYASNRVEIRALAASRYEKYAQSARRRAIAWANDNPDRVKANRDRYIRLNPDKIRQRKLARRASKFAAEGRHTTHDIRKMVVAQRGRCGFCKTPLKGKYHIDHRVPLSRGGTNWPNNLQLLCGPCNLSKNNSNEGEWARRRGLLL